MDGILLCPIFCNLDFCLQKYSFHFLRNVILSSKAESLFLNVFDFLSPMKSFLFGTKSSVLNLARVSDTYLAIASNCGATTIANDLLAPWDLWEVVAYP